jgi:poly [ADP-ribose] polymerase
MVDNLLEIEVAYNLLKTGNEGDKDPIDVHYEQLKTDMKVVDKKSEEFKRVCDYVKNTHGATHTMYDLKVEDVSFKLLSLISPSRSSEEFRTQIWPRP